MELQEARKKCLCSPCHPVPPTKGICINREPGIHKPVWHHSTGVTVAFPPFIQKATISKSLLHLVALMTCSFSPLVVSFFLWKQGLRLWTSDPDPFQGRCHKIRSRLYEKCHLVLNLAAKTKMQMYILKTLLLKGCPSGHQLDTKTSKRKMHQWLKTTSISMKQNPP